MTRRVAAFCEAHGSITIAPLRDELGTSRKYAQALLEHFDAPRVTRRRGDEHVLPPALTISIARACATASARPNGSGAPSSTAARNASSSSANGSAASLATVSVSPSRSIVIVAGRRPRDDPQRAGLAHDLEAPSACAMSIAHSNVPTTSPANRSTAAIRASTSSPTASALDALGLAADQAQRAQAVAADVHQRPAVQLGAPAHVGPVGQVEPEHRAHDARAAARARAARAAAACGWKRHISALHQHAPGALGGVERRLGVRGAAR